jgi:hypothetical protein
MADTLSALNIPKATAFLSGADAPVTPKGYIGMREVAPIQEELAKAESQAQKDVGMADIEVERAKKEETTRDLESQAKFAQEEAAKLRDLPERQAMKEKREEFGNFKFVPTKENADDLATLFSLVSVIGMAIGGGGKQNAQQAMSAMNGMLEGHQKGRADLYKQQQIEFDKNFKAMQAAVQSAEKEYEEAVRMNMVDKEAGEIARKMALAKLHSPMLKAMEDRLGPLAVLNTLKELKTSSVKNAIDLVNNLQDKADRRQDAKDRQRQTMEQAVRLARIRAEGSGASTPSGKGGAVQFRYNQAMTNAGNQLANEIENAASLPISATPPVLAEVLTDPTKGLSDAGKRFFSQKITDEEARAFQQVFAGMTRAITTIEASGRPSGATEGAIREFSKSQPRAGDKKINIYLSLAQSKQVMDILVKDLKAAEANSTQIAQAEEAKKRVDSFITWTVRDVNRIISSGARTLVDPQVQSALGTSQNLNEFNKQVGPRVSKNYATEADAEKAFKAGTLKSGEKVNIGGVFGTWE